MNQQQTKTENSSPHMVAVGGGGGGGGGGPGGGRGGDGGSVIFGIHPDQVGIQHVKNPHRQYWEKILNDIWSLLKKNLGKILTSLIIAGLIYWLGWN